jgi:hypothetical protein
MNTYHGILSGANGVCLKRDLCKRSAQIAGVAALPFRSLPVVFPVNTDEGSKLPSFFFQGQAFPVFSSKNEEALWNEHNMSFRVKALIEVYLQERTR